MGKQAAQWWWITPVGETQLTNQWETLDQELNVNRCVHHVLICFYPSTMALKCTCLCSHLPRQKHLPSCILSMHIISAPFLVIENAHPSTKFLFAGYCILCHPNIGYGGILVVSSKVLHGHHTGELFVQ
jgi:hypothetical protein